MSTTITCPAGVTTTLYTFSSDSVSCAMWSYDARGNSGALHRCGDFICWNYSGAGTEKKETSSSIGTTSDLVLSFASVGDIIVWKATTTSYEWEVTFTEIFSLNTSTYAADGWTLSTAASGTTTSVYSEDVNKDGAYHIAYLASGDGSTQGKCGEILFSWDDSAGTVSTPLIDNYVEVGTVDDMTWTVDMTAALGTLRWRVTTTSYDWPVYYKKIASL